MSDGPIQFLPGEVVLSMRQKCEHALVPSCTLMPTWPPGDEQWRREQAARADAVCYVCGWERPR